MNGNRLQEEVKKVREEEDETDFKMKSRGNCLFGLFGLFSLNGLVCWWEKLTSK